MCLKKVHICIVTLVRSSIWAVLQQQSCQEHSGLQLPSLFACFLSLYNFNPVFVLPLVSNKLFYSITGTRRSGKPTAERIGIATAKVLSEWLKDSG